MTTEQHNSVSSQKVPARLFGPSYDATGLAVELQISSQLHVHQQNGPLLSRIAFDQLTLSVTGFDEKGLRLAWTDSQISFECHILQPAAVHTFRLQAPTALISQLNQLAHQHKSRSSKRLWAFSAVGVFVSLPFLFIVFFLMQSDAIANKVADLISIEQEQLLGDITLAYLEKSESLKQSGEAWEKLNTLGQQLTDGSQYTYTFYILNDATLNAFAIPGGSIVFHQGLIDSVDDWTEVAGVLAHEIQHIEQRHSLKALIKKGSLYLVWGLISGGATPGLLEELSIELLDLRFSRDFEREADDLGFDLLVAHDIDPTGMIDFFERLDAAANGGSPPSWLSTHPASEDRAERLQARVEQFQIEQLDHSSHRH